jgi:hypothetical protein
MVKDGRAFGAWRFRAILDHRCARRKMRCHGKTPQSGLEAPVLVFSPAETLIRLAVRCSVLPTTTVLQG